MRLEELVMSCCEAGAPAGMLELAYLLADNPLRNALADYIVSTGRSVVPAWHVKLDDASMGMDGKGAVVVPEAPWWIAPRRQVGIQLTPWWDGMVYWNSSLAELALLANEEQRQEIRNRLWAWVRAVLSKLTPCPSMERARQLMDLLPLEYLSYPASSAALQLALTSVSRHEKLADGVEALMEQVRKELIRLRGLSEIVPIEVPLEEIGNLPWYQGTALSLSEEGQVVLALAGRALDPFGRGGFWVGDSGFRKAVDRIRRRRRPVPLRQAISILSEGAGDWPDYFGTMAWRPWLLFVFLMHLHGASGHAGKPAEA